MLKGIKISNGVTRDENPGGTPVFVHRILRNGFSDFSTFFSALIERSEYNWAFLNDADLWLIPSAWFDEMSDYDYEQKYKPESKLNELYNTGFLVRKPQPGGSHAGHAGIYKAEFIQKFAFCIKDDWNELIAINQKCEAQDRILDYFLQSDHFSADEAQTLIVENAEWYFRNFDGLFWFFFTKNPEDIDTIKKELAVYRSVEIEDLPDFDIRRMKIEYMEKPVITDEQIQETKKISNAMQKMIFDVIKDTLRKDKN